MFQWNLDFSIYTVFHNALQKECLKMYLFPPSNWAIKLEKINKFGTTYINGPYVDFRVQSTDVKLNTDICVC